MSLLTQADEINCKSLRAKERTPTGRWNFCCNRDGSHTDKGKCGVCKNRKPVKAE